MSIQLGLCCKNNELAKATRKENRVFCARKCSRKGFFLKGIDQIKKLALENIQDIIPMILWNEMNNIKVLRLSSELLPHFTDTHTEKYDMEFAREEFKKVGILASELGHRITFHPGQFNVLGSDDPVKIEKTLQDLKMHADILDMIDAGDDSVMVIHGGGLYKKPDQSLEEAKEIVINRWCENYKKMPENIQKRLVIENCEKCFSVEDCLKISKKVNIPVVLDTHHYQCYSLLHPEIKQIPVENLIEDVLQTWQKRNIKPKFHISEQGAGKCGNHSDYIEIIPEYLLKIKEKYNIDIDIMIEAKEKEKAIKKLHEKYPFIIENYQCKIKTENIKNYTQKLNNEF